MKPTRATAPTPNDPVRLHAIRCWLLDMDGTVTLGEEILPGATEFFRKIAGSDYIFLTNNSSHSADHYVRRLNRLGIAVSRRQVLTSTDALALFLKTIGPQDRPVAAYPVGTPEFEQDLADAGIRLVSERGREIDFVVLGFDTSLVYAKLDIACDYIRNGRPYLAANPDLVCPLAGGKVLPDCGALIAFMAACTGRQPLRVIGKPDPAMAQMVLQDRGYRPEDLAMIGDRLYTDIDFARQAGILGIAVLSGETSREEIAAGNIRPDFIFRDIGELAACLPDHGQPDRNEGDPK
ncbi:MAG TPA: HAD family hydrolase [Clostridiales bacterium]|nr:HAD family hydrolase [Clostridiales bacterium]